jgi:hypothetical protein
VIVNIKKDVLLGFSHRFAYATLIPALVWIFVDLPLPKGILYPGDWIMQVVWWLDLPIALASQIMPCDDNALDIWFRVRCPDLGYGLPDIRGYFYNHMRVGIPVYLLLFYLPNIYCAGLSYWRRRRASKSASAPVEGEMPH